VQRVLLGGAQRQGLGLRRQARQAQHLGAIEFRRIADVRQIAVVLALVHHFRTGEGEPAGKRQPQEQVGVFLEAQRFVEQAGVERRLPADDARRGAEGAGAEQRGEHAVGGGENTVRQRRRFARANARLGELAAHDLAVGIELGRIAERDDDAGCGLDRRQQQLVVHGRDEVVGIEQRDEFGVAVADREIARRGWTTRSGVVQQSDRQEVGVIGGAGDSDGGGVVGAAIVDDDDAARQNVLQRDALQRGAEEATGVVGRHDDVERARFHA